MKFAAVALAFAALAAGSASTAERVTDVDYMKAGRCKGLATGLNGVVDPAAVDAFMKSERANRAPYVLERADNEFQRARREAKSADRKDRLTAELTGACQAYLSTGASVARQ